MKSMDKYDENREKFKEVMGKPEIKISVELPEGYENRKKEFLELQKEEAFLKDVSKSIGRIVKKHLKKKKQ